MAPIDHARIERAALCNLFTDIGPNAPTLCEGWTTRDLAAHLIVREHRPDAAIGLVASPLAAYGEKVRLATAARSWDELVAEVRAGPPVWSPMRIALLDRATNTVEFFVHHEASAANTTQGTSTSGATSTSQGTNSSSAASTTTTTPTNDDTSGYGTSGNDSQGSAVSGQASSQPQTSTHTS